MRWLSAVMVVTFACGSSSSSSPPRPKVSAADQQEITRLVGEAKARALARDQERRTALAAAVTTLVPRADLGGCPFAPSLPDPKQAPGGFDVDRMKRETDALQRIELRLGDAGTLGTGAGPLFSAFTSRVSSLDKGTLAYARTELAEIDSEPFWDYDVVFVEDARQDAARGGDDGFVAGRSRGRAFLYSFAQKKVLCTSEFDVTSSDRVKVRTTQVGDDKPRDNFDTAAGADLIDNAMRGALRGLVLAGPPAAADQ